MYTFVVETVYSSIRHSRGTGIQGPAGAFVSSISGCYFNVMGFPIHKFAKTMSDLIKDETIKP